MKKHILHVVKGFGMGAANVIPGVSGGTIALVTGIFERLINSIKSFNLKALKLLFAGKLKEFFKHTDFLFLVLVFFGAALSIFTLANVLDYLFINYPIFIWSYFFGLIMASVYFVGKTIEKWNLSVVLSFVVGTAAAIVITLLTPAKENDNMLYLVICGVVGICSMILPGLSGSFILILMGNYRLVMIDAVNNISEIIKGDTELIVPTLKILIPVGIGVVLGLLAFSHLLSWVYKKFKNQTIALLSGFILGSLGILWPWKKSFDETEMLIQTNDFGAFIDHSGKIIEEIKIFNYKQTLPGEYDWIFYAAVCLVFFGMFSLWIVEKLAQKKT